MSSFSQKIRCSLTISQIIPPNHVIWDLVQIGNADAIRNLLVSNQISIDAQDSFTGSTPLRVRNPIPTLKSGLLLRRLFTGVRRSRACRLLSIAYRNGSQRLLNPLQTHVWVLKRIID